MQDNKFNIGQEVWFYEDKKLFNGYITNWSLCAGRTDYDYSLKIAQNNSVHKSESELFNERDFAANAMQGIKSFDSSNVGIAEPII